MLTPHCAVGSQVFFLLGANLHVCHWYSLWEVMEEEREREKYRQRGRAHERQQTKHLIHVEQGGRLDEWWPDSRLLTGANWAFTTSFFHPHCSDFALMSSLLDQCVWVAWVTRWPGKAWFLCLYCPSKLVWLQLFQGLEWRSAPAETVTLFCSLVWLAHGPKLTRRRRSTTSSEPFRIPQWSSVLLCPKLPRPAGAGSREQEIKTSTNNSLDLMMRSRNTKKSIVPWAYVISWS